MTSLPKKALPRLGKESNPDALDRPSVAVFVHGIYSSSVTFNSLIEKLRSDKSFDAWSFDRFDYDFKQNIPDSGNQLARALEGAYTTENEITLVCHSMGGLVARLALLRRGDRLPFVKRVIMLGTPNHGTLHTARFGLMFQILRGGIDKISAIFPRKRGILELTEVSRIMDVNLTSESVDRTLSFEYVTIPGLYFHEDRDDIGSVLTDWGGFGLVNLAFKLTGGFPHWEVGLDLPHDGIVEEDSVRLRPDGATRASEMTSFEPDEAAKRSVHVRHRAYKNVNHVQLQSADCTVDILRELLPFPNVASWWNSKIGDPDYLRN